MRTLFPEYDRGDGDQWLRRRGRYTAMFWGEWPLDWIERLAMRIS